MWLSVVKATLDMLGKRVKVTLDALVSRRSCAFILSLPKLRFRA